MSTGCRKTIFQFVNMSVCQKATVQLMHQNRCCSECHVRWSENVKCNVKFLRTAKEPALVRLVKQRHLLNSNPLGKLSLPGDKVTAYGHLIKLTDKEQGNFESVSWIMLIWLDIR